MITTRLKTLVKYIDKNDKIIDIGCDHALLDIYLVKNKIIDNLIVSDVHDKALDAGIKNIKKYNLVKQIDARLGNGLDVLNESDKINTILISGMGSSTIINILNNGDITCINKLILQSNNNHELLRKEIIKLGFYIDAEEYFQDNFKNYINIVFKRGSKKYTKDEIKYGPYLIHDKKYLEFELNKLDKISNLIPKMKIKYKLIIFNDIKKIKRLLKKLDN